MIKYRPTGQLEENIYFSGFWRLDVQDQNPAARVLDEGSLPVVRQPPSRCMLTWQRVHDLSSSILRMLTCCERSTLTTSPKPDRPSKSRLLTSPRCRVGFQHRDSGVGVTYSEAQGERTWVQLEGFSNGQTCDNSSRMSHDNNRL